MWNTLNIVLLLSTVYAFVHFSRSPRVHNSVCSKPTTPLSINNNAGQEPRSVARSSMARTYSKSETGEEVGHDNFVDQKDEVMNENENSYNEQSSSVTRTSSSSSTSPSSSFDMDFAEAMSKPLPEWFEEEKQKKDEYMKVIEDEREKILDEFKAKYELSEEDKMKQIEARLKKVNERKKTLRKNKSRQNIFAKALGISSDVDEEEVLEDETTRDKWEKFWVDEEATTGFSLPGFFEVFPELKLMWPTWAKKRDGSAIQCKVDADCQFPQACCPHPIIPGDKFCCTGWTQRIMVPAYARQMAKTSTINGRTRDEQAESDRNGGDEEGLEAPDYGNGYPMPEN
jgi:hypothetical protein